jgi:hypothetical protein
MRWVLLAIAVLYAAPCGAAMNVRISDLQHQPQPPNPVQVFGRVTRVNPLTLTDGKWSIRVDGVAKAELGQFLYVTGDWDGQRLLASSTPRVLKRVYPKYLSLGDSITYHPPLPSIGWYGAWGMKASAQEKDYVHLVMAMMRSADTGNAVQHYSSYGANQEGGKIIHILGKMDTYKSYKADLITLQIGENDHDLSIDQFRQYYEQVLDALLDNIPRPRIFCFGTWSIDPRSYEPGARVYLMEQAMKAACDAREIPFRSLRDVGSNPICHDPGGGAVNWHPNDAGMQGYADLFWDAMGPEMTGD